jgi:hypothetical protein
MAITFDRLDYLLRHATTEEATDVLKLALEGWHARNKQAADSLRELPNCARCATKRAQKASQMKRYRAKAKASQAVDF